MLAEGLEPRLQAWVRIGLVAPRAAVRLAALPRGNQPAVCELVMQRGLTVRQTELLVSQLLDSAGAAEQEALFVAEEIELIVQIHAGLLDVFVGG